MTILSIYIVLLLGGLTIVVPFLMTLTASVSNAYDLEKYRMFPRFLWDDDELYCKYLVEKQPSTYFRRLKSSHQLVGLNNTRELMRAPDPAVVLPEIRAYHESPRPSYAQIRRDYHAFLENYPPQRLAMPNFIYVLREDWRRWLRDRYIAKAADLGLLQAGQDTETVALDLMNREYGEIVASSFDGAEFPEGSGHAPKMYWRNEQHSLDYQAFLSQQQIATMHPQRADFQYQWFLRRKHVRVEYLNHAWGATYEDFSQIIFPLIAPDEQKHPGRFADWWNFRDRGAKLSWIHVSGEYSNRFRVFLKDQVGSLRSLSKRLETPFESWGQVPFTRTYQGGRAYRALWSEFVLKQVPVEDRQLFYFEKEYVQYLKAQYGTSESLEAAYGMPVPSIDDFRLPYAGLDYDDFYRHRGKWRLHFLTHNFVMVFKYIATKGRALWNTLILVGLTILGGVTINPIAAFALSRYRVPGVQIILLFLLIPMAFPPEVSMIPNFLLLRSFPLMIVITVLGAVIAILLWVHVLRPLVRVRRTLNGLGLIASCGLAVWLVPFLFRAFGAPPDVLLLNTYTALIMPGLANGFSIFLLKGFFDGLPRELYEAAQIDGASELLMFRVITYPLAKPIIAYTVIGMALGAYGGFMWAFVVVPDERMWTLMVWLYQFSVDNMGHQMSLVMASLVVASIPTLLFFAFCQRIILRGIILPVMK